MPKNSESSYTAIHSIHISFLRDFKSNLYFVAFIHRSQMHLVKSGAHREHLQPISVQPGLANSWDLKCQPITIKKRKETHFILHHSPLTSVKSSILRNSADNRLTNWMLGGWPEQEWNEIKLYPRRNKMFINIGWPYLYMNFFQNKRADGRGGEWMVVDICCHVVIGHLQKQSNPFCNSSQFIKSHL